MKKLSLYLIAMSFVMTSCSSESDITNVVEANAPESLLKSFEVKRDANGRYSVDYNVNEKTAVESVKNIASKTNEIYLYSANNINEKKHTEDLALDNNMLKVDFIDKREENSRTITIEDENITLAKGAENEEFLRDYSFTSNDDGTYQLDFNVNNKISTNFVYNEEKERYEIHLKKGESQMSSYSRNFTKKEGVALKIYFMNHGYSGRGEQSADSGKPVIILNGGN